VPRCPQRLPGCEQLRVGLTSDRDVPSRLRALSLLPATCQRRRAWQCPSLPFARLSPRQCILPGCRERASRSAADVCLGWCRTACAAERKQAKDCPTALLIWSLTFGYFTCVGAAATGRASLPPCTRCASAPALRGARAWTSRMQASRYGMLAAQQRVPCLLTRCVDLQDRLPRI